MTGRLPERGSVEGPGDYAIPTDTAPEWCAACGCAIGRPCVCSKDCQTGHELADPTIDATVRVDKRQDEDGTVYWRVTVTVPAVPGPGRETTTRDYAAWDAEAGWLQRLPHEAALDLLGLVLTS
jgi:hypothetical protein